MASRQCGAEEDSRTVQRNQKQKQWGSAAVLIQVFPSFCDVDLPFGADCSRQQDRRRPTHCTVTICRTMYIYVPFRSICWRHAPESCSILRRGGRESAKNSLAIFVFPGKTRSKDVEHWLSQDAAVAAPGEGLFPLAVAAALSAKANPLANNHSQWILWNCSCGFTRQSRLIGIKSR